MLPPAGTWAAAAGRTSAAAGHSSLQQGRQGGGPSGPFFGTGCRWRSSAAARAARSVAEARRRTLLGREGAGICRRVGAGRRCGAPRGATSARAGSAVPNRASRHRQAWPASRYSRRRGGEPALWPQRPQQAAGRPECNRGCERCTHSHTGRSTCWGPSGGPGRSLSCGGARRGALRAGCPAEAETCRQRCFHEHARRGCLCKWTAAPQPLAGCLETPAAPQKPTVAKLARRRPTSR